MRRREERWRKETVVDCTVISVESVVWTSSIVVVVGWDGWGGGVLGSYVKSGMSGRGGLHGRVAWSCGWCMPWGFVWRQKKSASGDCACCAHVMLVTYLSFTKLLHCCTFHHVAHVSHV